MKNRVYTILGALLLICILIMCTACNTQTPSTPVQKDANSEITVLGEGANNFFFDVITADGKLTSFQIFTDTKNVGDALTKLDLIAGDAGQYGLYVKTVNGVTYDYDKDGKYWALYVNDTYALNSVDKTEIENGATYSFRAE